MLHKIQKTCTYGMYTNNLIDKYVKSGLWTFIFKNNNLYYMMYLLAPLRDGPGGQCGVVALTFFRRY